jgi:hypothetical protein
MKVTVTNIPRRLDNTLRHFVLQALNYLDVNYLNLGCLHPVACVRSRWSGCLFRLRNVTIVGFLLFIIT